MPRRGPAHPHTVSWAPDGLWLLGCLLQGGKDTWRSSHGDPHFLPAQEGSWDGVAEELSLPC